MSRILLAVSILVTCPIAAAQSVRYVNGSCGDDSWTGLSPSCVAPDGPKRTIISAISASENGDTVVIAPGTYAERPAFNGKAIVVRGSGPAAGVIIDGGGIGPVVRFVSGEGPGSVLENLTVTGGILNTSNGGGVLVDGASPTLRGCIIRDNTYPSGGLANVVGAGIAVINGAPLIEKCVVSGNRAALLRRGGGIGLVNSTATIRECTITQNGSDGPGGGLYIDGGSVRVERCKIEENACSDDAGSGGGVAVWNGTGSFINCLFRANRNRIVSQVSGPAVLVNCTLVADTPDRMFYNAELTSCIVYAIGNGNAGSGTVNYSNVRHPLGGIFPGVGNINADPMFASSGDYRLAPGSPCIDAGNSNAYFLAPGASFVDLGGRYRGVDDPVTPDTGAGSTPRVDMGAHEFQGAAACYANCDESTVAPILTANDFLCFINRYAAGCP